MAEATTNPRQEERSSISARRQARRRNIRILISLIVVIALALGGYALWGYFNSFESTDDAQIDGHVDAISARITGHVSEVLVEDAQLVKAGDVLIRIDPRDYEVAVAKAEGDLAEAEASFEGSRTDVPIISTNTASTLSSARSSRSDADARLAGAQNQLKAAQARLETAQDQVAEAEAIYKRDTDDAERYRLLVVKDQVSRQQYDQAVQNAAASKATVAARLAAVNEATQNVAVAESAIEQARSGIAQADALIQSAMTRPQQVAQTQARAKSAAAKVMQQKAQLDQARLNLSYTVITAPFTGIIGKKTVETDENVSPGQSLMAIVPLEDIWVTANFKETQLRRIKPGQKVTFQVDAYDHVYRGHITGVGGASGSRFSLLPPENATGNYVKVVQRVPVRIDLEPNENQDHRLRPGMSVVPKVYLNE